MASRRTPARPPEFAWRAEEVVQVVDHKPHLVVAISVTGGSFPHRALVPIMRIVRGDKVVAHSWYTEISFDNRTLTGYFATDLPTDGTIEFGYPDQLGRVPTKFSSKAIKRTDRDRLEKDVINVSTDYLKNKRGY